MRRPEWIEVGRVSRAHGVHGEVRVLPDSDNPDRFSPGSVLYARPERGKVGPREPDRLQLLVSAVRGDETFPIVAFHEIGDRERAETLRGLVLEVPVGELPPLDDDEFYPFELIGLEAKDEEGIVRARVEDVLDNPAHALLVLRPVVVPGTADTLDAADVHERPREILVPFVDEAVPRVDVEGGYVVVATRFLEHS